MKFISRPILCIAIASTIFANSIFCNASELSYLKPSQPNAAEILAPPPIIGSGEQAADMETVRAVYHSAGKDELAAANAEKTYSIFNFAPAVGAFFQSNNLPRTTAFFQKVQLDAKIVSDLGKIYFNRSRPYTTDPTLADGEVETSFSYPSGHSAEAMTLALVLADMFPEKREAILAHGRLMGWHRVQIARHYPTDVYAGRVLAQAVARQLKKSDSFEKDFAEAKAEVEAAKSASKN